MAENNIELRCVPQNKGDQDADVLGTNLMGTPRAVIGNRIKMIFSKKVNK